MANSASRNYGLIFGLALVLSSPAFAQSQPEEKQYMVIASDLQSLVDSIASDHGARLNVASRLTVPAIPGLYEGDLDRLLIDISISHGLDYFSYNGVHYLSRQNDTTTRIVPLDNFSAEYAVDGLSGSGLPIDQFPVRVAANGKMLVMSGPPHYLALAETVLARLEEPSRMPDRGVRVRRGIEVTEEEN